jgi:hypothetical protein
MSLVQRLRVSKDIDDLLDRLSARYDLPRKARVFSLALSFLGQVEKEDQGLVLGYMDPKERTFSRVALVEAAQALLLSTKSGEGATILYTLLLEEEDVKVVERLRVRFKLDERLQVYKLAVNFLRDIAAKEDKEISLALYNKETQRCATLKRTDYDYADKELKSLIGRLKNDSS